MNRASLAGLIALACLAGCSSVRVNPAGETATTHQPFDAKLGLFAHVSVPVESHLISATVDGHPAFCTPFPAYSVPGERRAICLLDRAGTGYLSEYYVLGTISSDRYPAHIPYTIDGVARHEPTVASAAPSTVPADRPYAAHYADEAAHAHQSRVLQAIAAECRYEITAHPGERYYGGYSRHLGTAVANGVLADVINDATANRDFTACIQARTLAAEAGMN